METGAYPTIYINLIHYPVFTLGIGKRIGIWLQGCDIGCMGCISQHTWKRNETYLIMVSTVLEKVNSFKNNQVDGITISGGEPFEQPDALYDLLLGIRYSGFTDIMVYSGYRYSYLKKKYSHILKLIDILVDGRFEKGNETSFIWKGSENQKMIILTEDLSIKEKYLVYRQINSGKRKLQLVSQNNEFINIIGIPDQKDSKVIKNGIL